MSIFGSIMSAIVSAAKSIGIGGASAADGGAGGSSGGGGGTLSGIDVEKVVADRAATKKEKLDWKHSIVDLMKVLDLDSSLKARQTLAKELNYTGDMNDSAKMNIWLHAQVMKKLSENGGKVSGDMMKK
jgi:hypothetical protein